MRPFRRRRSTPQGEHLPVLFAEVMGILRPAPGETAVDCTTGLAGHAAELLRRVGPTGLVVAIDLDPDNLPRAEERLKSVGHPYSTHHTNFAGIQNALGSHGLSQADMVLADLGMSSMQVDDAGRGFSYSREGPLDMRMDRSRGTPANAMLATMDADTLAGALTELGDEPNARLLAPSIVAAAVAEELPTTTSLVQVIQRTLGLPEKHRLKKIDGKYETHPAARTFQVLRILVNRELANLTQLLRVLPYVLKPGGRAAIISFHSGEDRLVKSAFRDGLRAGVYEETSDDPIRATFAEKTRNPRSRSAKLRWAKRAEE